AAAAGPAPAGGIGPWPAALCRGRARRRPAADGDAGQRTDRGRAGLRLRPGLSSGVQVEAVSTRSRPRRLARYSAVSAAIRKARPSRASAGYMAIPIEIVIAP